MKFQTLFIQTLLLSSTLFFSCKKDDDDTATPVTGNGGITLEFDNVAGSTQLSLDSTGNTFTNHAGEKFSVAQFNYYVSNIRLEKADGSIYTVPQDSSYFMVQESKAESQEVKLKNIPAGDYTKVHFTLGVDSLRSTQDLSKRTGVLSPDYLSGHGMYWSWNSGYIFMKLEGFSPAAPDSLGKSFFYHIGGFGGYSSKTINNIRNISLSFPESATVRTTITPDVHMLVDVLKVWNGVKPFKIAEIPGYMWGPASVDISNNYKDMIMVHHVHND